MCSRPRISFKGWKSLSSAETRLPIFLARSPIRSRSTATRMAPTISRKSIAIGWRLAMVETERSSIVRCRLSISASATTTRWPSATSRRISASTDSTIMRSARPPISATSRVSSCRSLSNALVVCSKVISVLPRDQIASAEAAGDVVLGASIARRREDLVGLVEFDQLTKIHKGSAVRDAGRLLHVVGDDYDGVIGLQLVDQLLDLGGRNRIERRARFVEQNHFGAHRDRAGDAKPLLLAARKAQAVGVELVLDLGPQGAALQRLFDTAVEFALGQLFIQTDSEGDVFVDRHRKRRRFLEHHADPRPQQVQVEPGFENVLAVEQHLTLGALTGIEIVHPIENAKQRRLAAARGTDEGGRLVGVERQADALGKHRKRDDERAGPGQILPILVGAERELENDGRQARHRRVEIGAVELIVERGE